MFGRLRAFGRFHPATAPESVYLYTLHKCASSLFGDYLLKNVKGLGLVDYEHQFYTGATVEAVTFEKRGFVYGPIRLSTGPPSAIYRELIEPVSRPGFVRDKIAVFVIRDPRDILVSAYYSFGYSHVFSVVKEIREQQQQQRNAIRAMPIDDYVVGAAPSSLEHFQTIDRLARACERGTVLKYEDMINDWEKFASGFTTYLDVSRKTLRRAYKQCRPVENEDPAAHRRSGKPGGYREKLRTSTIAALNLILAPVLERFEYPA
jgi:uncharacterized protein YukE